MTIIKYDPFNRVSALQHRINRLFEDSIPQPGALEEDIVACSWQPAVDVFQTDDGIRIKAEIPGVDKKDVSVELRDNVLTLKGSRTDDERIEDHKYYRRERCFGVFHRSFTLETATEPDRIKAKFENGILEVEVPRPEVERPKSIKVNIN